MAYSDRNEIVLSPAPHALASSSARKIMCAVIAALVPSAAYGVYLFGARAAVTLCLSIVSCVFFEALFRKCASLPSRAGDCSAIVTGMLLGMSLPPAIPFWMTILGSAFAVIVAKEFFGGLGANVFNPALSGRAFLFVSFSAEMTSWTAPFDATSSATPLALLNADASASAVAAQLGAAPGAQTYWRLFIGQNAGCIGESCSLLLILAFVFLIAVRVIDWRAPAAMIVVSAALALISGADPILYMLTGGLLFGAVFMTTDYATAPVLPLGRILFGAGAGTITFLIRRFGGYPEGVMFSILIMNALAPFLNRLPLRKYGYSSRRSAK